MLARLARFVVRCRKAILAVTALFFVAAAAFGGSVAKHLTAGGFTDPAAESTRAAAALERDFHTKAPDLVFLVTARHGTVEDPTVAAAGENLTRRLTREPGIEQVASYWTLGRVPPLRSDRGHQALVLASTRGSDDEAKAVAARISRRYVASDGVITVAVTGRAEIFREVGAQTERDLRKSEALSLPVTLLLLVLVFGSVVAAGLPLAVGGLSVVGTFLALRLLVLVTPVSIYSLNLTTAMGLGLAIDYSLFIVSRYREELGRGLAPHDAVIRTVETAGKTVAFSALTVAASLSALLVFPLVFLRSFAYAGLAVALVAGAGAVLTLPALLAVLGRNVDRWVLWRRTPKPVGEGAWHRVATTVMRRPIVTAAAVIVLLLVLGAPFLHVRFALPDERVLPVGAPSRTVSEEIRRNFGSNEVGAITVVAPDVGDAATRVADTARYAAALSRLPDVARVDAVTGSYVKGARVAPTGPASQRFLAPRSTWLSAVPNVEAQSPAGERLAKAVRAEPAPYRVLVGGASAQLVDGKATLFGRMPLAAAIIAGVTFVLLFMMFGGLLVPVKALVINVLSLTATFGAMVWIFQDGHLAGLLDFSPTGTLDTSTPILMFCMAFGLSMDYEVFLLSRIKEEHDRTGDNTASVALGLERTGRIVTAAAVLISVVMLATASSAITFIKMFGLGLALAVLMDAFVIRATLVPAFMRLAGEANWWAPAPLRRVYRRFGIKESHDALVLEPPDERPLPEEVGVR